MSTSGIIETTLSSVSASPATLALLRRLHAEALAEPAYVSTDDQPASRALEWFVALDPDKCALVYLLLRATGARHVVEAGTSFGLSTIYLALAVGQNAGQGEGRAGDEVERWIELREDDLRETLKTGLPEQVDLLLLDIWTALAMPTLKLVQPHLRIGAMVVADNILAGKAGYKELMAHLEDPRNGFRITTAPYSGGLCIAVYLGQQ
ncbi:hypothetical protein LQW54_006249 [Pestalotiopsis sp. IQ-011]